MHTALIRFSRACNLDKRSFVLDLAIGWQMVVILFGAAFVAGFVDSIAGGGGMITIPALLLSGIPPHLALGTNKLQSTFGSFSACLQFYQKGHLSLRENFKTALAIFVASGLGTLAILYFSPVVVARIAPFLLLFFGLYFLLAPRLNDEPKPARIKDGCLFFILLVIGFYDGFFGSGTGSFFIFVLVALGGVGLRDSLARSKIFNFSSNLAALLVFIINGKVLFLLGALMGLGQFLGAMLGSRLAIKKGAKLIKPLIVAVCMLMCAKMLYEQF